MFWNIVYNGLIVEINDYDTDDIDVWYSYYLLREPSLEKMRKFESSENCLYFTAVGTLNNPFLKFRLVLTQWIHHPTSLPEPKRDSAFDTSQPSNELYVQCSSEGCCPSKVFIYQRLAWIQACLHSKFVFHQILSFIRCRLSWKVIFHLWSSSIYGIFPY